ncbi:MAG TPA: hypothetical protein VLS28_08730 [Candidatus Sulfomarinibacteraceae bacterium]|nr:hypothetical protein [Candidatus Sulfomarinibacteraceae bacterium]
MPFGFGKKKENPPPAAGLEPADPHLPRRVSFHGLTETWRLQATTSITGRLLDSLNKREPLELENVSWAPLDGSGPFEPAPGIESVDPYDLIVVLAGAETLPTLSESERMAQRIHKVTYDVALEVPPLRVVGTVQLHPGSEPEGLVDRGTQMFVAVTNPLVSVAGATLELDESSGAALVNRFYLRGVQQVDLATGERHRDLPGLPLGGTTWSDKSRTR